MNNLVGTDEHKKLRCKRGRSVSTLKTKGLKGGHYKMSKINNTCKATWIVVTGLDGSGKTNLVNSLAEHYRTQGLNVATAHLPYDTHLQREVLPKLKHSYSDRLMFALDNHIFAAELESWLYKYDVIISQRGWFDSFVHGAVQGYDYSFIEELNRAEELPKCDVMVHLVANAATAFARIKNDPDADKFEYPKYIYKQEMETRRGYQELVVEKNPDLYAFRNSKNILIDTTDITMEETFKKALEFLNSIGIGK